ncbi:FecR family protein [Chitinophaga defluvii]|uniref:FecR domain-containing protein n=1 Tax=Chitinophaga defluvii TaxID=3163343 RepID=A0ABV2TB58_9BACT
MEQPTSMDKYASYSVESYLEDDRFIQWVIMPDEAGEAYWQQVMHLYPAQEPNFRAARHFLMQLRIQDRFLSDTAVAALSARIWESARKQPLIVPFIRKYAAAVLLLIAATGVCYYFLGPGKIPTGAAAWKAGKQDSAFLVLGNGKKIALDSTDHIIHYLGNKVVINQDTIKVGTTASTAAMAMNELIVPDGRIQQLELPDGTSVWVKARSRLRWPETFAAGKREVSLQGEAYFEVAQNSTQPFAVSTNNYRIDVLGTGFNVATAKSKTAFEAILETGKIAITGLQENSTPIILKPGQRAALNPAGTALEITAVNTALYTSWRSGLLLFEHKSLQEVMEDLRDYYHVRFDIQDPALAALPISGKLTLTTDIQEVMKVVATVAEVQFTIADDVIRIY